MNKILDLFNVFSKEKLGAPSPLKLPDQEDKQINIRNSPVKSTIISEFEEWATAHAGMTEVGGNTNRADYIDDFNACTGAGMGKPYCLSAYQYCRRMLEKKYDIRFDIPFCAGTQQFWSMTKPEYRFKEPDNGRFAVFRSAINPEQGHIALCLSGRLENGTFNTFEFNTSGNGSRNGLYQMRKTRNVGMNGSLILLGFVDYSIAFKTKNNV